MKKILIISTSNKGTIAMCTRNLYLSLLEQKDIEVMAVMLYKEADGLNEFDGSPYLVNREINTSNNISYLKKICGLKRIKKEFKPDLTISTLDVVNTLNVLSGVGEKKIGISHSPIIQAFSWGFTSCVLALLSHLLIYPFLTKLYCVSTEVMKSETKFPFMCKDKIDIVYNIHNVDDICKKASEAFNQDELTFVDSDFILFIGRLNKNKAPFRAIEAFRLSNFSQKGKLVLMGPETEDYYNKLIIYLNENNLNDKVFYIGSKPNPYKYIKRSRGVISSSYTEGLPGVLIESLILNKPVIATNSSIGVWEILDVKDHYSKEFDGVCVLNEGCISSNLAYKKSKFEKLDIDNLAKAIDKTVYREINQRPHIVDLIDKKNIIDKFLI